ncbi:hypothetical protein F5880DRAFT_104371 [Lentinula raphanica]|nr:hypothetical protein F5880DRAFT_104371 [Lentinula raphanica]
MELGKNLFPTVNAFYPNHHLLSVVAQMSNIEIIYDRKGEHILSKKAIKEGWDTFIFRGGLPATLLVGINTTYFGLTTSDVARWLSIITRGKPGNPPDVYPCEIATFGILLHETLAVDPSPVNWDSEAEWAIGNYTVNDPRPWDNYCTGGPIYTIQEFVEMGDTRLERGLPQTQALATIEWKVTPGIPQLDVGIEHVSIDGKIVALPSVLVDAFLNNLFGIDVVNMIPTFIKFPGLPSESSHLLDMCCVSKGFDMEFVMKNFRDCLQVHCLGGDVEYDFGHGAIDARLELWNEQIPSIDKDMLDVVIRADWIKQAVLTEVGRGEGDEESNPE